MTEHLPLTCGQCAPLRARRSGWEISLGMACQLGLRHNYLLQVQSRKSGLIYSTPVNVVDLNGKRFLVAPRGETSVGAGWQVSLGTQGPDGEREGGCAQP